MLAPPCPLTLPRRRSAVESFHSKHLFPFQPPTELEIGGSLTFEDVGSKKRRVLVPGGSVGSTEGGNMSSTSDDEGSFASVLQSVTPKSEPGASFPRSPERVRPHTVAAVASGTSNCSIHPDLIRCAERGIAKCRRKERRSESRERRRSFEINQVRNELHRLRSGKTLGSDYRISREEGDWHKLLIKARKVEELEG